MNISSWWRIQTRMFRIYLEEYFYVVEWPLRSAVNLCIFLSIPLWIGVFYQFSMLVKAWDSHKNVERDVLLGKIWFWDQYKIY